MYKPTKEKEYNLARQNPHEVWNCVLSGKQKLRMVSPAYKNNLYSGTTESLEPSQSPVNLFHRDESAQHATFPLTKHAQIWAVELTAGNCIYIPSYWWSQEQTESGAPNESEQDELFGSLRQLSPAVAPAAKKNTSSTVIV